MFYTIDSDEVTLKIKAQPAASKNEFCEIYAEEAIKIRMEQMHLKQKDLIPYIGNKSKVSEVISGKIGLSLSMISKLSRGLHLPLEVLMPQEGMTHRPSEKTF